MEYEEYLVSLRGLSKRFKINEALIRQQTQILASALGVKSNDFNSAWPNPLKPNNNKSAKKVLYKNMWVTERQAQVMHEAVKEAKSKKRG